MAKSDLRIDVLGTVITISTDEKQEYLDMLLVKFRDTIEKVRKISGLNDPLKLAVLTGFILCDDMEKALSSKEKNSGGEAERLALALISRLDEILPEDGACSKSS